MQAIIMAGGKGTRLSSVIKDVPKPMALIAGKPLLEYTIQNLKENDIKDIILVVGHLGNIIQEYFQDGQKWGVNISYFIENNPMGTAGALFELADRLENNFYLIFGDLFINVNYKKFWEFHEEKEALITLFTHPNSHPYDSDIVVTNDKNRVIGWERKNCKRVSDYKNLVNAGIYVVNKNVINRFPRQEKIDMEKDIIIPLVINNRDATKKVFAYQSSEYVKDIGTPERLLKVEKDFINGICESRNLKNRQKCIFLDRDGTINKHVGFLRKAEQVELEDTVAEAIKLINESEYLAIVITNQPVVARGECTFDELENIHKKIYTLLGNEGAYIDGLYFCPHHPDSGFEGEIKELKVECKCRKPKIGMLQMAKKDFNIDLENSWFVGDTYVDVQTGINGGMRTILLESGDSHKNSQHSINAYFETENLLEAVRMILKGKI